jgi:hypothetical protein
LILLLRALSIGDTSEFHELVGSVLVREGIECVAVTGLNQALWFASPTGVDLIVLALSGSQPSWPSILNELRNGSFGIPPPPVVVWTGNMSASVEGAPAECDMRVIFLAGGLEAPTLVEAIESAFAETGR